MILTLENRIRDLLFTGIRSPALPNNPAELNKLLSSLDLLGDTQLAVEAYPQFHDITDKGTIYLIIYGILQTLQLQQEAVQNIATILKYEVKMSGMMSDIRIIRNDVAGHPMSRKENKSLKSNSIFRNTISTTNLQLMTTYSGETEKKYETPDIYIPPLIERQTKRLSKVLEEIIIKLEEEEKKRIN